MLNNLISRLPDGRAINELVNYLKQQNNSDAFDVIEGLLNNPSGRIQGVALQIIPRVVRDCDALIRFLDIGLSRKNISGTILYVRATVGGLGYKRLLKHLQEIAENEPEWIAHVWYHLVPQVKKEAPEYVYILEKIRDTVDIRLSSDLQDFWQRNKSAVSL